MRPCLSCICSGAPSLRGRLDGCDAQVRAQWRHRRRHAHQDGTLQKTLIQLTLRKSRLLQLTHRPKVKSYSLKRRNDYCRLVLKRTVNEYWHPFDLYRQNFKSKGTLWYSLATPACPHFFKSTFIPSRCITFVPTAVNSHETIVIEVTLRNCKQWDARTTRSKSNISVNPKH